MRLLIQDDLGMRKLPMTAAEDLLEIIMRWYERASTLVTSKRPVDDWGKLLVDAAAVGATLDRLLHHGHLLECGPGAGQPRPACLQATIEMLLNFKQPLQKAIMRRAGLWKLARQITPKK